jgi:hypothetical protein
MQRRALGESKLHDSPVGFACADDTVVRPNRSTPPLPLLDDVRVCFLDEFAHSAKGFPAPVPEFSNSSGYKCRCRLALARVRFFHVLIPEVPDIFHLHGSAGYSRHVVLHLGRQRPRSLNRLFEKFCQSGLILSSCHPKTYETARKPCGWKVHFADLTSGRLDDRPGPTACLKAIQSGNTLMLWKLDRLVRDLRHRLNKIEDLRTRGVALKVLTGAGAQIDTTTANGRLALGIFATLAEFEREVIAECTMAGLIPARGRMGGRARKMDRSTLMMAIAAMQDRKAVAGDVAMRLGLTTTTLDVYVNGDWTPKAAGQALLDGTHRPGAAGKARTRPPQVPPIGGRPETAGVRCPAAAGSTIWARWRIHTSLFVLRRSVSRWVRSRTVERDFHRLGDHSHPHLES